MRTLKTTLPDPDSARRDAAEKTLPLKPTPKKRGEATAPPQLRAPCRETIFTSGIVRIEVDLERAHEQLEQILGHRFASPGLLTRALTHRSLANDQAPGEQNPAGVAPATGDNERLEYLGDAVLGLVVAEALFKLHPDWSEGALTRVRSMLVSREHMADVAAEIDLGSYLLLSRGEEKGGLRRRNTVLSNSLEAVLAAVFLDGGLEPVRTFARRYIMGEAAEKLARELRQGAALGNYKSALQEHLQASHAGAPIYRLKSESGPDHRKRFLVEVRLKASDGEPGKPLARGRGTTKKHAEQDAAKRALERLKSGEDGSAVSPTDEEEQNAQ